MVWHTNKGQFWFKYDENTNLYRNLTGKSIKYELEQSLKRLKTDYIDLYQTHIPDPDTPISETMDTLLKLKEDGKIRAIGASNISIDDLKEYKKNGGIDSDQEKYSLLDLEVEKEILPWCNKNIVTFMAYSPLSQGLLTGRINPQHEFEGDDIRIDNPRFSEGNIAKVNDLLDDKLKPIAESLDVSITQLVIGWVTSHQNTVALCGARNEQQAMHNAKAGDILLSDIKKDNIRNFFINN
jgi:aryl-alcohol dehydrogenase-like predicted oxidoreductase